MTRPIKYMETKEYGWPPGNPPKFEEWTTILKPGEVMFARGSSGMTSKIISKTDGFFSHSGIYLGLDENKVGWIAHSYVTGVQRWDLTRWCKNYEKGSLGWARTNYDEETIERAIDWAGAWVPDETGDIGIEFDYADLGLAFAVLLRAAARRRKNEVPKITEEQIQELFDAAHEAVVRQDPRVVEANICSAFVWRAFSEGGREDVLPNLLEGVRVTGGELGMVNRDMLAGSTDELSQQLSGLGDPVQTFGLTTAELSDAWGDLELFKESLPGARALLDSDKTGLLNEVITPGDLWCSPTMTKRGRLI